MEGKAADLGDIDEIFDLPESSRQVLAEMVADMETKARSKDVTVALEVEALDALMLLKSAVVGHDDVDGRV